VYTNAKKKERHKIMALQTIRQVSLDYGISRRMLTYYEEVGLMKSSRKDDYAYRVYDEDAIKRLQQIIILRKLHIPIKQIKDILNNQDAVMVIEIFKQNIKEFDEKITAMSAVKSILQHFIEELQKKVDVNLKFDLLNDQNMADLMNLFSIPISRVKEKISMEELNMMNEKIDKLHNVSVRVELAFNGNCMEAIVLYEKAFGVKVEGILRYKDVPPEDGIQYSEETGNFVMHTWLKIGNDAIGEIGMHDRMPDNQSTYGDGVSISVGLGSTDAVKLAFNTLKEGGVIGIAPATNFFSECYCEVKDKFGINWIMMYN